MLGPGRIRAQKTNPAEEGGDHLASPQYSQGLSLITANSVQRNSPSEQSLALEVSWELSCDVAIGSVASAFGIPGTGTSRKWAEVMARPSKQAIGKAITNQM